MHMLLTEYKYLLMEATKGHQHYAESPNRNTEKHNPSTFCQ